MERGEDKAKEGRGKKKQDNEREIGKYVIVHTLIIEQMQYYLRQVL